MSDRTPVAPQDAYQYKRASTLATRALIDSSSPPSSQDSSSTSESISSQPKYTTSSSSADHSDYVPKSDSSRVLHGQGNSTSNYATAAMTSLQQDDRPTEFLARQPSWSMADKKREHVENMIRRTSGYNARGYTTAGQT